MLNHGKKKNNNIPKKIIKFFNLGFIFLIHQKIKWKNNLRIVLVGFVIVASWTFVIKNSSSDEWTRGKT